MKKRSLIVILAVLCIATSCFVSSTFAKYTSSAEIKATATAASWEITANSAALSDSVSFDLFATSAIVDTLDGNTDAHVANGKIAPGTKGTFDLVLANNSDVTAQYKMTVALSGAVAPQIVLSYAVDDVATEADDLGEFVEIAAGDSVTITVNWVWAFDADDTDNEFAGQTVIATANIVVEQVD